MDEGLWSSARNVGILFAETEEWEAADLASLRRFDAVLVGSTWNARALLRAGVRVPVAPFMQGVDASLFAAPSAVVRPPGGPFRVFSGGKLEWRKGQDIVVEAFKRFRARRPEADAVLLAQWVNPWRQTVLTLKHASFTAGVPAEAAHQRLEANASVAPARVREMAPSRRPSSTRVMGL